MDGQLCLNASIKFVEYTKKKDLNNYCTKKARKKDKYKIWEQSTPLCGSLKCFNIYNTKGTSLGTSIMPQNSLLNNDRFCPAKF